MKVIKQGIVDVSDSIKYITPLSLDNDVTIIIVYKTMFRSDDVLVDIYLNEIAEETKVLAGRKLTCESLICLPKYNIGLPYHIKCIDQDGINASLNKYNAHKFYLQFTSYEGEDWII